MELSVSKRNGGYPTIMDAVNAIPADYYEQVTIHVDSGIYEENVLLSRPRISLIGESPDTVIIRSGLYAKQIMPNGTKRGTFRTATLRTDGDYINIKNITIENNAGNGRDYGQAIALYADGDQFYAENCKLIAHQDTLFTAPLPPLNKYGKNEGFGPKQNTARKKGRHIYKDCCIQGDIDFIFGGAMALFKNCEILSKCNITEEDQENNVKGYISAPCTPKEQDFGYLFYQCKFVSDCPKETVYLSRPWREYGKSVIIDSFIDSHIKAEGYHDWGNASAGKYTYYAEGLNTGLGSIGIRVPWQHHLSAEQSEAYVNIFCEILNQ